MEWDFGEQFFWLEIGLGEIRKKENREKYDLILWTPGWTPYNESGGGIYREHRVSARVVHSGFVAAAIKLQKRGVTNAFMNEDLRAHWNAFRETSRRVRGGNHWERKPPPSIEFPPSLAVHFIGA